MEKENAREREFVGHSIARSFISTDGGEGKKKRENQSHLHHATRRTHPTKRRWYLYTFRRECARERAKRPFSFVRVYCSRVNASEKKLRKCLSGLNGRAYKKIHQNCAQRVKLLHTTTKSYFYLKLVRTLLDHPTHSGFGVADVVNVDVSIIGFYHFDVVVVFVHASVFALRQFDD